MIETRLNMLRNSTDEVNQLANNILYFPQLDMMTQLGRMWFFDIVSTCLPVLKCIEKSSTTKEPELQENFRGGSQNVTLAPPHSPLMLITDDNASMLPTEMKPLLNMRTNVENDKEDWPDLEKLLDEAKSVTPQVERLAPEPESPTKIERIPSNPFQILARTASGTTSAILARMRWTPQLHDQFIESTNQLGSSRNEGFETQGSQAEEASSLRVATDDSVDIDINEALTIQKEVQKQLHEHLEMQRKLQMRLHEQGKHLKEMIGQQQHVIADQSQASSLSPL